MSAFARGREPAPDVVVPDPVPAPVRRHRAQQPAVQPAAPAVEGTLKIRNVANVDWAKVLHVAPVAHRISLEGLEGLKDRGGSHGRIQGVESCPRSGYQAPVSVLFDGWVHSAEQKRVIEVMLDVAAEPGRASVSDETMM